MAPADPIAVLRASAEWQALIAAVRAAPEDPVARAAAADWLTEKLDDHPLARFVTDQLARRDPKLRAADFRAWYLAWPWAGPVRIAYRTWTTATLIDSRPRPRLRDERVELYEGLVNGVRVRTDTWLAHGPAIVRHPLAAITGSERLVSDVQLLDCPPLPTGRLFAVSDDPDDPATGVYWPDADGEPVFLAYVARQGIAILPDGVRAHLPAESTTESWEDDLSDACLKWAWATEPAAG